MPENPGQTVLWLEHDRLAVRRPGSLPFAVELTPVTEALVVAGVIPDPSDESAAPRSRRARSCICRAKIGCASRTNSRAHRAIRNAEDSAAGRRPLPWLARELKSSGAINLLQGEFAAETDYGARWRQWRIAAALAAGLLIVHVGAQALQLQRAKRQTAHSMRDIAQVFTSAMPTEKPTTRAAKWKRGSISCASPRSARNIFCMQCRPRAGVSSIPKTSIDALSYREQTVDMKVTAASVEALSQLSQVDRQAGLTAEIQSSTPVAGGVEAHMQIHTQAARPHP
jgi:type II secretion system protein L